VETDGQIPVAEQTFLHDFHATHRHFPRVFIDRGYKVTRYWQRQLGEHFAYIFDLPTNPLPYISFSPYIHDVRQFEVLIDQYGRMVSIDTWGDGARHAMKLLVPLILLRDDAHNGLPGIVLWEDPELFLHPNALYRLMHEVLMLIKDYPIQLFITTQSLEAVASLTTLVQDMGLSPDVLRAFRQKLEQGDLTTSWFDTGNLDAWLGSGLDPRYWQQGEQLVLYQSGEEV
jgi:alpha-amylase/alpha-mannosidase (GH57 family)